MSNSYQLKVLVVMAPEASAAPSAGLLSQVMVVSLQLYWTPRKACADGRYWRGKRRASVWPPRRPGYVVSNFK